eukprot:m.482827 g.482827  ORF g.482827 m.482827 type:complete len:360 (-) comp22680_c0_seq1:120-1199(-)
MGLQLAEVGSMFRRMFSGPYGYIAKAIGIIAVLLLLKRYFYFDVDVPDTPAPCSQFGWREREKPAVVWDVFPINTELDMMEARLNELDSVVDHFVVTEAPVAFSGKPKPFHYNENKERFKKFHHKLIHVMVPDLHPPAHLKTASEQAVWRKVMQKNGVMRGMFDAMPEDVVIVSDLDEVPRASVIEVLKRCEGWTSPVELQLDAFIYDFGCSEINSPSWRRAKVIYFDQLSAECDGAWDGKSCFNELRDNQHLRLGMFSFPTSIRHAGWHMSYFMSIDLMVVKVQSYAHVERDTAANRDKDNIECKVAKGVHFGGKDHCTRKYPSTGRGPKWCEQQANAGNPSYTLWYHRDLHPEKCKR